MGEVSRAMADTLKTLNTYLLEGSLLAERLERIQQICCYVDIQIPGLHNLPVGSEEGMTIRAIRGERGSLEAGFRF